MISVWLRGTSAVCAWVDDRPTGKMNTNASARASNCFFIVKSDVHSRAAHHSPFQKLVAGNLQDKTRQNWLARYRVISAAFAYFEAMSFSVFSIFQIFSLSIK